MMSFFTTVFRYWLFASAFSTIFIIVNSVLESVAAFRQLYSSWEDCMILLGYSHDIVPIVRSVVVALLAIAFLRFQRVVPLTLLPGSPSVESDRPARRARGRRRADETGDANDIDLTGGAANMPGHFESDADNAAGEEVNVPHQSDSDVVSVAEEEMDIPEQLDSDADDAAGEAANTPGHVNADANANLTVQDINVRRLLGREGFMESRRRILQRFGRYPPLETFPLLDAFSLRPYHRFSDPSLYDGELLALVRPLYRGDTRTRGSAAFFADVDRLIDAMDLEDEETPLPLALRRHPRLVHSHPYMAHTNALAHVSEMVYMHNERMIQFAVAYNALHREQRLLVNMLIHLLGRLDLAATYGDLLKCRKCLDLIDNVVTSLRGLIEVEYSVREQVHREHVRRAGN